MANTQTTVPTFVPGQVLEAAQLNNSAGTGVPVFATTVTRDAGFGGAGEKALAEGQLCYLESTNVVQYYDGAAWATLAPAPAASSGLTYIAGSALTGSSVTFNNCFSATYNTYFITILGVLCDASTPYLNFRFGSSTTQTYNTTYQTPGSGQTNHTSGTNVNQVTLCGLNTTDYANSIITTAGPFLTQNTLLNGESTQATQFFGTQCNDQSTSSFTSFTISIANNFSAGSVKIYGYANS